MKNLLNKFRSWLIIKLSTKQVVAIKLEKARLCLESKITACSLTLLTLPDKKFCSMTVHYGASCENFTYDDLELAEREFNFISQHFKAQ